MKYYMLLRIKPICYLAITLQHVNHDILLLILLPLVLQPFVGFSFLNQVIPGQDILLPKIYFYWLYSKTGQWFPTYLDKRKERVDINYIRKQNLTPTWLGCCKTQSSSGFHSWFAAFSSICQHSTPICKFAVESYTFAHVKRNITHITF